MFHKSNSTSPYLFERNSTIEKFKKVAEDFELKNSRPTTLRKKLVLIIHNDSFLLVLFERK